MVLSLKRWKSRSSPGIEAGEHKTFVSLMRTHLQVIYPGAGWSSPVARQAHNLKVTGSNPVPATTPIYQTVSGYPEAVFLCLLFVACRQSFAACCAPLAARRARLAAFLAHDVEFLGIFWDSMLHPRRRDPHGAPRRSLCGRLPKGLEALVIYVSVRQRQEAAVARSILGSWPRICAASLWRSQAGIAAQQGPAR